MPVLMDHFSMIILSSSLWIQHRNILLYWSSLRFVDINGICLFSPGIGMWLPAFSFCGCLVSMSLNVSEDCKVMRVGGERRQEIVLLLNVVVLVGIRHSVLPCQLAKQKEPETYPQWSCFRWGWSGRRRREPAELNFNLSVKFEWAQDD